MKNWEPLVPGPAFHEIVDDPMETQTVVEPALSQVDEVGHRYRGFLPQKVDPNRTFAGLDDCL
jgi:hypothetical protein